MAKLKVITVNQSVFAENDAIAAETREALRKKGLLFLNVMASPGAGKTTLLLATIRALKDECRIGVMEADIEATVDAKKIEAAGARAIQVHTGGACAMDAAMTREAVAAIGTEALDLLILENVGNLVCPAETDTGAAANVVLLSVPEGDDKPLKYPLMFSICDVVLINKIDALPIFDTFSMERARENILMRNPNATIIPICAKTGEGIDQWAQWLRDRVAAWKAGA